uniref:Uncharacterized protein n=1 Tax=Anopheles christyi TaxID=43041 RepID=A0A182K9D2_9DIPT
MKQQEPLTFQRIAGHLEETYYSAELESWHRTFMHRVVTICKEALEIEWTDSSDQYPASFKRDVTELVVELVHNRNQLCNAR